MKNKVFTLALLLLMIASAGVWAQNLPTAPGEADAIWTSAQSSTTEGRYRSNADDFMRPDSYTGVKFNKWFGLAAFQGRKNKEGAPTGAAVATVGFATSVSSVYIGALYNGNLWFGTPANNYREEELPAGAGGGITGGTYDIYPSITPGGDSVNNAAVLVGFADMGVRLTYRTNYQSFNQNDIVVGNTGNYQLYKSYQTELGYIAPQIAWAMSKNLLENGIKPYVTLDLVWQRDYQKIETSGADSYGNSGERTVYSRNRFDPSFGFGLNGYNLYNKDGFRLSTDLDYVLALQFYDNEYSYADGGNYKTVTGFNGTFSQSTDPWMERSYISNVITPSLSGQWSKDKLALKFKLNMVFGIYNEEANTMALNSSNDLVYNDASKKTDTFTFRPDLRLALQYKIIPDKLILNAGARLQATAIALETVTETNYTMGTKNSTVIRHQDSFTHQGNTSPPNGNINTTFASRFSIGPTFYFTENAWVEATTGVTNKFGDGAIDVFAPGGLFSFGSILVALKF